MVSGGKPLAQVPGGKPEQVLDRPQALDTPGSKPSYHRPPTTSLCVRRAFREPNDLDDAMGLYSDNGY